MTTGYICDRCGAAFEGGSKWLMQGGYGDSTAITQRWALCPYCVNEFIAWLDNCGQISDMSAKSADCVRDGDAVSDFRESAREHYLESESVREQSESVRERRYESQDVTDDIGCVTESPEMLHDTREKLEEDVRKNYAYSTTTLMYPPSANKTTDMLGAMPIDTVFGWLDRQAAITKRETLHSHPMCAGSDACPASNRPIGESADRETPDTAGIGASKDEIRDFDDYCETCERIAELEAKLDAEAQHAREAWRLWGEADVKLERMTSERDHWKDAFEDSERMRLALVVGEEIAGRQ